MDPEQEACNLNILFSLYFEKYKIRRNIRQTLLIELNKRYSEIFEDLVMEKIQQKLEISDRIFYALSREAVYNVMVHFLEECEIAVSHNEVMADIKRIWGCEK